MEAKKLYKNYDKRVQEYMGNVIECLKEDYGKIPESLRIALDLIADNYSIYLTALDNIKTNGLIKKDNQGRTSKNQCVQIMNNAQYQLTNLLKSFAMTPVSKAKMKSLKFMADKEDEDEEEYLDSLTY